jgi:hypothetical protein
MESRACSRVKGPNLKDRILFYISFQDNWEMATKDIRVTHAVRLGNWRVKLYLKSLIFFLVIIDVLAVMCQKPEPLRCDVVIRKATRINQNPGKFRLKPWKHQRTPPHRTAYSSLTMFSSRHATLLLLRAPRFSISIQTRHIRARQLPTLKAFSPTITKSRFYSQDAPKPSKFYSFQDVLPPSSLHSLNLLIGL